MPSDVVPPLSVRVFAALAVARIILFTLGKLLSILALVAVLDNCDTEALADMAYSCLDSATDTLYPTTLKFFDQPLHALFSFAQVRTPTFLRLDLYHIVSQVWDEIEPCIPPPPIQFCVLGRGIQCGSGLDRRPATEAISDLASRLVCHLVDFAWSLGASCVDNLSTLLSSSLFWYSLLSLFASFGLSSLWMLQSAGRSLDDYPLEPLKPLNARLLRFSVKIRSLWSRLRKHDLHALVSAQYIYVCWPSQILRACFFEVKFYDLYRSDQNTIYHRKDLSHYLFERLARSVLYSRTAHVVPYALAVLCLAGVVIYVSLLDYSVWRSYLAWRLTRYEDALRLPNTLAPDGFPTHDHIPLVALPIPTPAIVVTDIQPTLSSGGPPLSHNSDAKHTQPYIGPRLRPIPALYFSRHFQQDYNIHPDLYDKYEIEVDGDLGQGSFGFVLRGARLSDEMEVAIKVLLKRDERGDRFSDMHPVHGVVPYDVLVMEDLDHDNIIRMLDVFTDDTYVYVVQELHGTPWFPACPELQRYYPNGDRSLSGFLMEHHHMSTEDASYVFSQLVEAVSHLHSKGYAHCDIKPSNILIDDQLKVKLIDFGNAFLLPKDWDYNLGPCIYPPLARKTLGTMLYTPPEMLYGDPFIPQGLDVWALGVTLFEILAGYRPFKNESRIMCGVIDYDYTSAEACDGLERVCNMWSVIGGCLDMFLGTRMTVEALRRPEPVMVRASQFVDGTWIDSQLPEPGPKPVDCVGNLVTNWNRASRSLCTPNPRPVED